MARETTGTWNGVKSVGAKNAVAYNASDTVGFTVRPDAVYVGVSGNVVAVMDDGAVTIPNVPVGILPISPTRINVTSTTASGFVAFYFE